MSSRSRQATSRFYAVFDPAAQEFLEITRSGVDRWWPTVSRAAVFTWKKYAKNAWSLRVGKRPQLTIVELDRLPDRRPEHRQARSAAQSARHHAMHDEAEE